MMNSRKKLEAEREMTSFYAMQYGRAETNALYYKDVAETLAHAYLLALGMNKEDITAEKIEDTLDKIGGRKELW